MLAGAFAHLQAGNLGTFEKGHGYYALATLNKGGSGSNTTEVCHGVLATYQQPSQWPCQQRAARPKHFPGCRDHQKSRRGFDGEVNIDRGVVDLQGIFVRGFKGELS